MSLYDKIDSAIVQSIKSGRNSFVLIFNSKLVLDEALRISSANGRDPDRIVDGRLQALGKRGVIVHVTGWGWRAKEAE